MKKVAFICVHNSCRSQMAEALAKHYCSDTFEAYSAGTEIKDEVNKDAVKIMKQLYSIDMKQTQYSKLIEDIPTVDIVITMGCNVDCPMIPSEYREDWGLDDPSGKGILEFEKTARLIEKKVLDLRMRIQKDII